MLRKMIKKIISLVVVSVFCVGAIACNDPYPEYESGYFKYAVKTEWDRVQQKYIEKAYIVGLTESGEEQEILIYPEEIEGIPVDGFGYTWSTGFYTFEYGLLRSENLRKFYFPTMPKKNEELVSIRIDNARLVYWNLEQYNTYYRIRPQPYVIYGYNYIENDKAVSYREQDVIGNVSYLYNYEENPNEGYYWVDSYEESIITFIPPEPQRDGYTFGGWYKESECINEWDFETDITGKEIILNRNKTYDTYDGIYLYAKWVEN